MLNKAKLIKYVTALFVVIGLCWGAVVQANLPKKGKKEDRRIYELRIAKILSDKFSDMKRDMDGLAHAEQDQIPDDVKKQISFFADPKNKTKILLLVQHNDAKELDDVTDELKKDIVHLEKYKHTMRKGFMKQSANLDALHSKATEIYEDEYAPKAKGGSREGADRPMTYVTPRTKGGDTHEASIYDEPADSLNSRQTHSDGHSADRDPIYAEPRYDGPRRVLPAKRPESRLYDEPEDTLNRGRHETNIYHTPEQIGRTPPDEE